MKTRTGFVSNSSSSSFIVTIPENFVITDELLNKLHGEIYVDSEEVKEIIELFIQNGYIDSYEEHQNFNIIDELYRGPLSKFKIADIEGGADSRDSYYLITIDDMKKYIEKSNNYKA